MTVNVKKNVEHWLLFILIVLAHREPVERDGGEVPDGGGADDGVGGHPDGAKDVAAAPLEVPAVPVVRAQRKRHSADQEVSNRLNRGIMVVNHMGTHCQRWPGTTV